jgi:hypothetical protein
MFIMTIRNFQIHEDYSFKLHFYLNQKIIIFVTNLM